MAQPVLPLSAVVEAGGQSSVGPANYLLLEAAALRLVLAQGFQREPFQSLDVVMMHVILRSRKPLRLRRRRFLRRRHQCDFASDMQLLLLLQLLLPRRFLRRHEQPAPSFGPAGLRALEGERRELRKTSMRPQVIANHGHYHWAQVVNCLKTLGGLRHDDGLGCLVEGFWRHKAP